MEAEMESEVAALQQEKDALEALHTKMSDLETKSQQEKEKVFTNSYFQKRKKKSVMEPFLELPLADAEIEGPVNTQVC